MSITKRINLISVTISIVLILITFIVLNTYKNDLEKKVYLETKLELNSLLTNKITAKKTVGITNAISIANDGRIKKALKINDRSWGIATLSFISSKMKKDTPLKNVKVHIHTKYNYSFVRNWKPEKFGDDLSSFRQSIVTVNNTVSPVNGFEIGKAGLSLRSVVPVIDDNGKHLGSLEFMQGLNSVAKYFDKRKDNFIILMDKSLQINGSFSKNKELNNYIISQKFINQNFLQDSKKIDFNKLLSDKFLISENYFYIVKDVKKFDDQKLGIMIVGRSMDNVNLAINEATNIINIALSLMIMLVVILLISNMLLFNILIKQPLNQFQKGLLNFFKFLNKESFEVILLNDKRDDEIGLMAKVVNKNINKTKLLIQQDEALINDVKRVVSLVKDGKIKQEIQTSTQNESLEELKIIFNEMLDIMAKNICGDINKIQFALDKFKSLDFTHRIEDAKGKTSQGLNALADIINDMLLKSANTSLSVQSNSTNLTNFVSVLSNASNQQAANLEEVSASLEEMVATIQLNSKKSNEMKNFAQQSEEATKVGKEFAIKTGDSMEKINESTSKISDSVEAIEQIAFQTNILSLNAAVEAATAGEAGKGFAVVAAEVRNLASRSDEAAKEIKDLVQESKNRVADGKEISEKMIIQYETLNHTISKTVETIDDMTQATQEQTKGIEQISDSVVELDTTTQENTKIADDTNDIAKNLSHLSNLMIEDAMSKEFIGKNTISNNGYNGEKRFRNPDKRDSKTERRNFKEVKVNKKPNINNNEKWESF